MSTAAPVKPKAGLEDVVAGESAICYIDGDRGVLSYCGYDIHELADMDRGVFESLAGPETIYVSINGQLRKMLLVVNVPCPSSCTPDSPAARRITP